MQRAGVNDGNPMDKHDRGDGDEDNDYDSDTDDKHADDADDYDARGAAAPDDD